MLYLKEKMIKTIRFLTMSILITSFIAYASEPVSGSESDESSSLPFVSDRQINSLMEAYMEGKLEAAMENDIPMIKYIDYVDNSVIYVEPLEDAHKKLKDINRLAVFKISGWEPFPIQLHIKYLSKDQKIQYLLNLSEEEKIELQMIRLYDFLRNENYSLPEDKKNKLKQIIADDKVSDEEKERQIVELMGENFEELAETIGANRSMLAQAMENEDVSEINAACSKTFHFAQFVSLNKAIQQMVDDIEKDDEDANVLLNNYSRVNPECSIM